MDFLRVILVITIVFIIGVGTALALEQVKESAILQLSIFIIMASVIGLFVFKVIPLLG